MPEGPPPIDWQGKALDCDTCVFSACLELGQCGQGWSCVHDRYAKRIERFFVLNPDLADSCLDHPYFETRMNAVRVASIFRLPGMLEDEDAAVRGLALMRLPSTYSERHVNDPDRRVRIAVAHRLPPGKLLAMAGDPDAYVRTVFARRAEPAVLTLLISDEDPECRRIAARRMPEEYLSRFREDPDPLVRREAAMRKPGPFVGDEDLRVRHAVAEAGDTKDLTVLLQDDEPLIVETASKRLDRLQQKG